MDKKVENHPVHQAMVEKHKAKHKIIASKNDTIVVIQYGTGKVEWYTKKDALEAIIYNFDLIEDIYFAELGGKA